MSSSYSKKHNSAEFKLQDQPSLPEWTKPQHMHAQYGLGWECLQFKEGTNKQASNKEKQETHSPFLALTQIYCTAQVAKQNSHTECFKLCLKIESVGSSCHEKPRTVLTLHLISDLRLLQPPRPISYCPVSTEAQASAKSWITPSTRQESSSVSSLKVFLQMKWQTNTGLLSGPFPISPFCKGSTRARLVQQNLHLDLGRSFPDFEEAGPQVSCWQTTKAHSWSHCPNLY